MKSWKPLVCLLALLTAVPAVRADGDYSIFNLGIGGFYWDAKDIGGHYEDTDFDYDGLWGGSIIVRIRPIQYIGIDIRAGAAVNQVSESYKVDGRRYEDDATFLCVPVEIGLLGMIPLGSRFTLYAGPGAGYYYYNYNESSHSSRHGHHYRKEYSEDVDFDDDFGWYAVGGLTFQVCKHFSIFGEARYTDTDTKAKDIEDAAKIDCSGVGFQLGVIFDF